LLSTIDAINIFNAMTARMIARQIVKPVICICGLKHLFSEEHDRLRAMAGRKC